MFSKTRISFLFGLLFLLSSEAQAQPSNYIDFSQWNGYVNGSYGHQFSSGDTLSVQTKIRLINTTNQAVNATIKIYIDGNLHKTIGPVNMPTNTWTDITAATTQINNATNQSYTISADVTVKDGAGNTIGIGDDDHVFNQSGGGGGGVGEEETGGA